VSEEKRNHQDTKKNKQELQCGERESSQENKKLTDSSPGGPTNTEALRGESRIRLQRFNPDDFSGALVRVNLLPGAIPGISTELLGVRGPQTRAEPPDADGCVVLIGLGGSATVRAAGASFEMRAESVVRLPYARGWTLDVAEGESAQFIRLGLALGPQDRAAIAARPDAYAGMIARRIADCPAYTESIKTAKTVSRMLLLEGEVPRFGAGTVETAGPDSVGAHEHPILEQLFLGLSGCRCTVHVGDAEAVMTQNCLLYVPLGSRHSVEVAEGDRLYYLWLDFFRRIEDQSYLTTAHKLKAPDGKE
jgi:mannose-6-phosphate isomerase-like protein (cupin superfamily)